MGTNVLDDRRAIFVVSGTQGSGKTTVSSLLARRFGRGVHVSADVLHKMIVSGVEWPVASQTSINTEIEGETARQLALRLHNACLLARSFFDEGFTVVLEDIVIGARLTQLRQELAGLDFMFVKLVPSKETVRKRELLRGTTLWRDWEWLTELIESSTDRPGLWIDSSPQTADATVEEIMRRHGAKRGCGRTDTGRALDPVGVPTTTRDILRCFVRSFVAPPSRPSYLLLSTSYLRLR